MWRYLQSFARYDFQTTMFQPVGGMDMIGRAFAREVGDLIRTNAKVTQIQQNGSRRHRRASSIRPVRRPCSRRTADWCICTIPLPILSQLPGQCRRAR